MGAASNDMEMVVGIGYWVIYIVLQVVVLKLWLLVYSLNVGVR